MNVDFLKNRKLIALGVVALVTLAVYLWMIQQPFFESFISWAQQHLLLYIVLLTLMKITAIVWPPLPGSVFTLGSIPVIGWFYAFVAEVVGATIGSSIAFFLGRKYGYRFLGKLFDESVVAKVRNFRLNKKKEFEAIFLLRLFLGILSEAISYGSGIIGIRFRNFLAATVLAQILIFPVFYLAGNILAGRSVFLNVMAFLIFGYVFWKLKGRYLE